MDLRQFALREVTFCLTVFLPAKQNFGKQLSAPGKLSKFLAVPITHPRYHEAQP